MDKTIVSFFFENFISFNFADSSSFVLAAHDRREHDILQKKNSFQSNQASSHKHYLGS